MRVHLAMGNTTENVMLKVLKESKYILISYAYFEAIFKRSQEIRDLIMQHNENGTLLLDSGAFTEINKKSKKGDKEMDWDKFVTGYINIINTYKIKHFFEMDIDVIVGYNKVLGFRKRLEQECWKGSQVIPVWHTWRGKQDFIDTCKKYKYVAYGAIITEGISLNLNKKYFNTFCKVAAQYGCKLHALGLTTADLHTFNFYSADSSSWTAPARFGFMFKWDPRNKKLSISRNESGKKTDTMAVVMHSIGEWVKYQKYLDSKA